MSPFPMPEENTAPVAWGGGRDRIERPTVSGMVTAGASVLVLAAVSLFLLFPAVFYVTPLSAEADGVTLCLPGVGPVQRFREDLRGEQEERTFIHEAAHAEQCRAFGAAWYARQLSTPHGRLAMEAEALCAEVAVLSKRGGDSDGLAEWAVETLATEYFDGEALSRWEIEAAVAGACSKALAQ